MSPTRVGLRSMFLLLLTLAGARGGNGTQGTPRRVARLPLSSRGFTGPVFSADGRTLAVGLWEKVILWEVSSARVRAILAPNATLIHSLVLTPDGKTLFVAGGSCRSVAVWDLTTRKRRGALRGHCQMVSALALTPDGKVLASGDAGGSVKLWDPATGKERAALATEKKRSFIHRLRFSPNGRTLAVSGGTPRVPAWGEVQLWDMAERRLLRTLRGFHSPVACVAFSSDGKLLVADSGYQSPLRLWNVRSGRLQAAWPFPREFTACTVAFSADGRTVAVGGSLPHPDNIDDSLGEVRLLEAATGKHLGTIPTEGGVDQVRFLPGGKLLAIGGQLNAVTLWDLSALTLRGAAPLLHRARKSLRKEVDAALCNSPGRRQRLRITLPLGSSAPVCFREEVAVSTSHRCSPFAFYLATGAHRGRFRVRRRVWG